MPPFMVSGDSMGSLEMGEIRMSMSTPTGTPDSAPSLYGAPATGRRIDPVRWWVYASITGAAALGAVAIYASESAEDVQHIRITGP